MSDRNELELKLLYAKCNARIGVFSFVSLKTRIIAME
jgi:hypothetical protein